MELLDTIPVYENPLWIIILALVAISLFFGTLCSHSEEPSAIGVGVISFIVFIVTAILIATRVFAYYDHDEYVVRLTDVSATEFLKDYEVVKTYEYSDVWRVKKKDGVK